MAKVFSFLLPSLTLSSGLEVDAISRDEKVVGQYIMDTLVHDKISAVTFLGFIESGKWILKHADNWELPLLLMHGGADRITSIEASKKFADKAGDLCKFIVFPDSYHELHNDLNKQIVFETIINWLNK